MTTSQIVTAIAQILSAVASVLWPIFAFTVLVIFRGEIRALLTRVKKGKLFGQEFELDQSVRALRDATRKAEDVLPAATESRQGAFETVERKVLDEATQSPKAALMVLAAELEREVRNVTASMGLKELRPQPGLLALEALEDKGLIQAVREPLRRFREIRNRVVHGRDTDPDVILSAIDSGLVLLKAVQAIPHERHLVRHVGVPIFADPECKNKRENATGVILETRKTANAPGPIRIFPTRRTHFQPGEAVAWEWDMDLVVGESWYRDPDTNQVCYGWTSSGGFAGTHLADL